MLCVALEVCRYVAESFSYFVKSDDFNAYLMLIT
nr:MAG TPA: hypothetical protein [Caudoviricetes sp.]